MVVSVAMVRGGTEARTRREAMRKESLVRALQWEDGGAIMVRVTGRLKNYL